MKITITAPKKVQGKDVHNRISRDYMEFGALLPIEDYKYIPNGNFHMICIDPRHVNDTVFKPKSNRQKYYVKGSDQNIDGYEPFLTQGSSFEPLLIKCWLPYPQLLRDTLESITHAAYFDFIEIRKHTLPRNHPLLMEVRNWMAGYNSTIEEEKERRKRWEEQLLRETELFEKARTFLPSSKHPNYLLD